MTAAVLVVAGASTVVVVAGAVVAVEELAGNVEAWAEDVKRAICTLFQRLFNRTTSIHRSKLYTSSPRAHCFATLTTITTYGLCAPSGATSVAAAAAAAEAAAVEAAGGAATAGAAAVESPPPAHLL